jgi:hypothetical protein
VLLGLNQTNLYHFGQQPLPCVSGLDGDTGNIDHSIELLAFYKLSIGVLNLFDHLYDHLIDRGNENVSAEDLLSLLRLFTCDIFDQRHPNNFIFF